MTDDTTTDFGAPRRTGLYAGAFERAQEKGTPILAVAFRRTDRSTVEVFKVENADEARSVFEMLLRDGVEVKNMWPISIAVGPTPVPRLEVKMPSEEQ